MSEETQVIAPETKEVPLDQVTDMREYKKARAEGKDTVTQVVDKPAEEVKEAKEEPKEDKPKHKGGWQARIDRLIKQQAALEQAKAEIEKKAADLEARLNGTKEEKPKSANGEPQRENFETDQEYVKALVKYERQQERIAEDQAAAEATRKDALKRYNHRMIELQAQNEENVELMKQDIAIPAIIERPIMEEMENGADVALYLAKNPDFCEKLVEASPSKAIAMVWNIS